MSPNGYENTLEKCKVLLLASNPADTDPLALGEEIREIEIKIRMAKYRDSIEFIHKHAVRPGDLQQHLLENKPHIVHFSGHGSESNEIILQDNQDLAQPVSPEALKDLFTVLKDNIRGVVLNACFSEGQAKAITEVIDFAVGMKEEIGGDAAILFAGAFYRAIGFNRSVKDAYALGIIEIKLAGVPEENTPVLLLRKGVDPSEIYLINP